MKHIKNNTNELSLNLRNLKTFTSGPSGTIPILIYTDFSKFITDTIHSKRREKDSATLAAV